jgi:hypothetical protein
MGTIIIPIIMIMGIKILITRIIILIVGIIIVIIMGIIILITGIIILNNLRDRSQDLDKYGGDKLRYYSATLYGHQQIIVDHQHFLLESSP